MLHCDHVFLFAINFYFDDLPWSQAVFNEDLKLEGFIEEGRRSLVQTQQKYKRQELPNG